MATLDPRSDGVRLPQLVPPDSPDGLVHLPAQDEADRGASRKGSQCFHLVSLNPSFRRVNLKFEYMRLKNCSHFGHGGCIEWADLMALSGIEICWDVSVRKCHRAPKMS